MTEKLLHDKVERIRGGVFAVYFGGKSTEWHTSTHEHATAQLMALTTGTASIRTESGCWVLPPERCIYLPPNTTHSFESAGEVGGFVVYLAKSLAQELPSRVAVFQSSRLLTEIVRRLAELPAAQTASTEETNLIRVLLDEMRRAFVAPLRMQMPLDDRLRNMAQRILTNPNEKSTIEELAQSLGMAERTLLRRFKSETGLTLGQWIVHARIHFADRQLREGLSVKQAAASAGYDSVSSFIKSFARIMGKTPGDVKLDYSAVP